MPTHKEISENWFLNDGKGNVLAVNNHRTEDPELIFTKDGVSKRWFNVLAASQLMYQELSNQFQTLQQLIELAAKHNEPILEQTFIKMQNNILLTQKAAQEGIDKAADEASRDFSG